MPSDDEHEKPPSIASLRSRFESLAASQKGLREVQVSKSRPASPAPDSIKTRAEGYSAGRSDGLAIVGARQDRQGIREPEQLSQGEQDGALRGNNPGGMGNGIGSAQVCYNCCSTSVRRLKAQIYKTLLTFRRLDRNPLSPLQYLPQRLLSRWSPHHLSQ